MAYSKVLESITMEARNKFIYGELNERETYFKELEKKYNFQNEGPVGIYIEDKGLNECKNDACDKITIGAFNSRYFEILVTLKIINKMLQELNEEQKIIIEKSLSNLYWFNELNKNNLEELQKELKLILLLYKEIYEEYIKTGIMSEKIEDKRLVWVRLLNLTKEIKKGLPNIEGINLLINKKEPFSTKYCQVINGYIVARSAHLSISIGCNNEKDWNIYQDLTGTYIEYVHDYTIVTMDEWKLERRV